MADLAAPRQRLPTSSAVKTVPSFGLGIGEAQMIKAFWTGIAILAWSLASPAGAAESRLFSDQQPLQLVITGPFTELVRTAPKAPQPYPATLSVAEGAGAAQTLPIQINARGLSRRTGGFCKFPPISLNFEKASAKPTIFRGQSKLKLVTYCQNQADYEQRIMLEYVAYRLYNVLTPISYNVRPAQVTYRTSDKDTGVTRFGFLVEDLGDLAGRNDVKKLKLTSHQIKASQFDAKAAGRTALFEFMIGNLDWDFLAGPPNAECCHNARFVAPRETAKALTGVVPIPYDFDYSGLVDAPYAIPPESLKIEHVTQRLYRGYCVSNDQMPAVIADFRAHRAEMMAVVEGDPRLNATFKAKTARFLDGFFTLLDDPGRVDSQILKRCRAGG
jgi:hypothetical protein